VYSELVNKGIAHEKKHVQPLFPSMFDLALIHYQDFCIQNHQVFFSWKEYCQKNER